MVCNAKRPLKEEHSRQSLFASVHSSTNQQHAENKDQSALTVTAGTFATTVRRKFFDVHEATGSSLAQEAIKRIAALYAVEKEIKGKPPDIRKAVRQAQSKPLLGELGQWLKETQNTISGKSPLAAAMR